MEDSVYFEQLSSIIGLHMYVQSICLHVNPNNLFNSYKKSHNGKESLPPLKNVFLFLVKQLNV